MQRIAFAPVPAAPRRLPAMPGLPYFGGIARMKSDPLGYLCDARDKGPVVQLGRLGGRAFYQVNDPELIREVLTAPDSEIDMTRDSDVLKALFNKSVFMLKKDAWRLRRAQLQPAFRASFLPNLFEAAQGEIAETVRGFDAAAQRGDTVDFTVAMFDLVQRMIVRMMFGVGFPGSVDQIHAVFDYGMNYRQRRRWAFVNVPLWLPIPSNRKFAAALAELNRNIAGIIALHRADPPERITLLTMLMGSCDEETGTHLTDVELLDEVKTVFNTGYVTTATSAVWTFDLLARHPEVMRQVTAEIDTVIGDRPLVHADLQRLRYTEAVIRESFRLYPPGWLTSRRVLSPITLGGYPLAPGSVLIVSQYALHRDPRLWANPRRFDPDRFLNGGSERQHKFAFLPFGAGPRICIGRGVAMMELKLILALLLRRFRFEPTDNRPPVLEALSILRRADRLTLKPIRE
ncbi:cytochrome P450 [Sphingomonas trueperi]|uniref:cytochrome P450 n=1 Tax=Sphingomonas trueperi TaxID=53317 RepID=UPI0033988B8B